MDFLELHIGHRDRANQNAVALMGSRPRSLVLMVLSFVLSHKAVHSFLSRSTTFHRLRFASSSSSLSPPTRSIEDDQESTHHKDNPDHAVEQEERKVIPPWTDPTIRLKSNPRFRQHVNPLANKYQLPADIDPDWPTCAYTNCSKPLHLDIGCGKGGYLWSLCDHDPSYNYLGLELRPAVAAFAKQRSLRHIATIHQQNSLDYIGCNANVDLGRILALYRPGILQRVTIQFPDPHFKNQHAKRRVVTDELIQQLAQSSMPEGGMIFLQSDVKGTSLIALAGRKILIGAKQNRSARLHEVQV